MRLQLILALILGCDGPTSERNEAVTPADESVESNLMLASVAKNNLALTQANFCVGAQKAATKQQISQELSQLCSGGTPTPLFAQLQTNAYQGSGTPKITTIKNGGAGSGRVEIFIAYAVKLQKSPVNVLLREEPYVATAKYSNDGFSIRFEFTPPPENLGDSDTSFQVRQFASRKGDRVNFDDTSIHDLKLYRLHPNNFEFLMAARSLTTPSTQFYHSVALRAVMASGDGGTYSYSVMHFIMNDRGEASRLLGIVNQYLISDMQSMYRFHQ